jgi:hypothetical protein
MAATAKVIKLSGDPKNRESAEHIVTFPGGAISVCRTSKNEYWTHIHVNKEYLGDVQRTSKMGTIEMIRMDTPDGVKTIDSPDTDHFAVLIKTNAPVVTGAQIDLNI